MSNEYEEALKRIEDSGVVVVRVTDDPFKPLKCENCGAELPWSSAWRQPTHYVEATWTDPGYWNCDRAD